MKKTSLSSVLFSRISQFFNEFSWQDIKEVSLSSITSFNENYENILKPALNETIYMSLMAVLFGFLLAIIPEFYLLFGIKMELKKIKSLIVF